MINVSFVSLNLMHFWNSLELINLFGLYPSATYLYVLNDKQLQEHHIYSYHYLEIVLVNSIDI